MIYVRGAKANAKAKWNSAVLSIKRELHNVLGGIDTSALNRVYSLFVNAYNRCVRLLKEMDSRYGSFIPPYNSYYDELPIEDLVDTDTFTAKLSLVLTEFDKLPKFNVPIISLMGGIDAYNANWYDFERAYTTKANNSLESVKKQVNDKGEHLGAVQAYAAKMNRYATEEQRTIAQEAANKVLTEVLAVTAGENAESLGAIEDSMNVNDVVDDDIKQQVSESKGKSEEIAKTEDPAERERKQQEFQDAYDKYTEAFNDYKSSVEDAKKAENALNDATDKKNQVDDTRKTFNYADETGTEQSSSVTDPTTGETWNFTYDGNSGKMRGYNPETGEVLEGDAASSKLDAIESEVNSNYTSAKENYDAADSKATESQEKLKEAKAEVDEKAEAAGMVEANPEETETSEP